MTRSRSPERLERALANRIGTNGDLAARVERIHPPPSDRFAPSVQWTQHRTEEGLFRQPPPPTAPRHHPPPPLPSLLERTGQQAHFNGPPPFPSTSGPSLINRVAGGERPPPSGPRSGVGKRPRESEGALLDRMDEKRRK